LNGGESRWIRRDSYFVVCPYGNQEIVGVACAYRDPFPFAFAGMAAFVSDIVV